jgi:hypothetical protein
MQLDARVCALVLGAFVLVPSSGEVCAQAHGRYIVNVSPLQTGTGVLGLCFAVDPSQVHGVWWWEPMNGKCTSRSTGPGVFRAERSQVTRLPGGGVEFRFQVAMMPSPHDPNPPDERVVVRIEEDSMRSLTVRSSSKTARRNDLQIPDVWR